MPRDFYFWNSDEFLIDGVPVSIGQRDYYEYAFVGWGRVKGLAWAAEQLFHRRLLHKNEIDDIIHRHYSFPDLQEIHTDLYKAEWAYRSSYTAYMTKRQLVRALPARRRCIVCRKRGQYFKQWHMTDVPGWFVKDPEFCSRECFHKRARVLEIQRKRRRKQWKEILIAKSKLKQVRRWLRNPNDPALSPTQNGE